MVDEDPEEQIRWYCGTGKPGVPLRQLEPVEASDDTKQAIVDWDYKLNR